MRTQNFLPIRVRLRQSARIRLCFVRGRSLIAADLINLYPDRFLFGTDAVAPADSATYMKIYKQYAPLWKLLDPETSEKVRLTNYRRLFDQARSKVRAWEAQHVTSHLSVPR